MKNYFKIIAVLLFVSIQVGCEDDDSLDIIPVEGKFELNDPSFNTINLNFGFSENPAITITWDDDITESPSYEVQMALEDTFTSPVILGTSDTNSFSMDVSSLNSAVLSAGATSFNDVDIYIRINAGGTLSNIISFSVNTYPIESAQINNPQNGDSYILSLGTLDDVAITVEWTDVGLEAGDDIDYSLEAASTGTDFASPVVVGNGTNISSIAATHGELNAVALGIGLTAENAGDIDMRVVARTTNASGSVLERISQSVTVSVTPFSVSFPFLYMVGDATTPGWDNNNNNTPLFRNQNVPNNYTYTGYFGAGAFKLLEILGQWQPQWGTNDGSTLAVNPGGGSDPGVFSVSTAGYYTYSFTTVGEGGSFTVLPYDASGATTYASIAIIGDATPNGWDDSNDTNLNQDPNNPHLWFLNDVTLTNGGQMLIRANDAWDNVWRYTGSGEDFYGTSVLAGGGDNIPFNGPTGTYDVWFNDLDGGYIFIPN